MKRRIYLNIKQDFGLDCEHCVLNLFNNDREDVCEKIMEKHKLPDCIKEGIVFELAKIEER